jgi:tetratricopeptide (TPR) repeat protein
MSSADSFKKALEELYKELPQITSALLVKEKITEFPSLIPPNEEKLRFELEEKLSSFQKRCHSGYSIIIRQLQDEKDPSFNLTSVEDQLKTSFNSILTPATFTQAILKIVSGSSWREALRISKDIVDLLYKAAKNLFDAGNYQDAINAFSFLSWLDSSQYDFWMALGHACFHASSYEQAISAYGVASSIFPQDGLPHIYAASCYEAIEDSDQAQDCLKTSLILEGCKEHPDKNLIHSIEQKIKDYKEGLSGPFA